MSSAICGETNPCVCQRAGGLFSQSAYDLWLVAEGGKAKPWAFQILFTAGPHVYILSKAFLKGFYSKSCKILARNYRILEKT